MSTAYAIALSSPTDQFHARALELAEQLEALGTRLVATSAVLLEIGNALSKQRYRQAAVRLLKALEADPTVDIVPMLLWSNRSGHWDKRGTITPGGVPAWQRNARLYSTEFKQEAVRLITEQRYGVAIETARNLGINVNMLRRWKQELYRQCRSWLFLATAC